MIVYHEQKTSQGIYVGCVWAVSDSHAVHVQCCLLIGVMGRILYREQTEFKSY